MDKKEMILMIDEIRRIVSRQENSTDEEIKAEIENFILKDARTVMLGFKEKRKLVNQIYYSIRKDLSILYPYSVDHDVTEIMVNGADNIFIERFGDIEKVDSAFISTEELEEVIRRIAARVHREINELNPIVDARLPDGSRVNAVYKNIALNGPILTIRKFPEKAITMEDLIRFGTISREAAEFLQKMILAGQNTFISGSTGSGKTTLLNVLSNYIPNEERVIVIEDSAELQIKTVENIVRMECRNANVQGKGMIDMQQLIKTSLRMRPNRIIVGEVRGKEVLDMVQAMNTGHDGSLSTGHGNSVEGMLKRLETMFLQAVNFPVDAIRSQLAEGIDIMVHLGRLPDRSRRVLEISEINGYENNKFQINRLFKFDNEKGLIKTGNSLTKMDKLQIRGVHL
ncbi:CpaF family protein [Clostridium aminobutyricum]|uniref:CpaF family protein n=1 Tax=Clostridium aminobutyricum TaxID=33953 RepID=A0A939IIN4_CLOAM|nr:CpaF family protein [Clostridium aminobutyricum]MBN7772679.1 CpaF family protein [Clostridium aminobutyricum]